MHDVVIACDKFKGSLTASGVIDAVRSGILREVPDAQIAAVPVADGGDGTLDAAVAVGFERHPITVPGPTMVPVATAFATHERTALVEMADACGLIRLPDEQLHPRGSSSHGLGQAIRAALDHGCDELIIGIGGSASTDGGAGMLQALGAQLTDASGKDVAPGLRGLADVARVDLAGLDPRVAGTRLTIACDVSNPLTGEQGAAAVFGPQKGLTDGIAEADATLARYADLCAEALGRDERDTPGAGAAGGVGFALLMLGAQFRPGIDIVLGLAHFDDVVRDARLVVTGEGSLDEQTLLGKTAAGVTRAAAAAGVPVVAVCGRALLSDDRARELGLREIYKLSDLEPDPTASMRDASALLERVAQRVAREHLAT